MARIGYEAWALIAMISIAMSITDDIVFEGIILVVLVAIAMIMTVLLIRAPSHRYAHFLCATIAICIGIVDVNFNERFGDVKYVGSILTSLFFVSTVSVIVLAYRNGKNNDS